MQEAAQIGESRLLVDGFQFRPDMAVVFLVLFQGRIPLP
jgi:hypothetical protein